jgi:biopolymer transport protein ExbD
MELGTGGKGKRRPLDTAINLVPFIDLMAVTISFLIMTAVWNQISRLQVSQAGGVASEEKRPETPSLPLTVIVSERGLSIVLGGSSPIDIPKGEAGYVLCHSAKDRLDDTCEAKSLVGELLKIKAELPGQRAITVQVEDGIHYGDLVRVLDACNLKNAANEFLLFPDVAVSAIG